MPEKRAYVIGKAKIENIWCNGMSAKHQSNHLAKLVPGGSAGKLPDGRPRMNSQKENRVQPNWVPPENKDGCGDDGIQQTTGNRRANGEVAIETAEANEAERRTPNTQIG